MSTAIAKNSFCLIFETFIIKTNKNFGNGRKEFSSLFNLALLFISVQYAWDVWNKNITRWLVCLALCIGSPSKLLIAGWAQIWYFTFCLFPSKIILNSVIEQNFYDIARQDHALLLVCKDALLFFNAKMLVKCVCVKPHLHGRFFCVRFFDKNGSGKVTFTQWRFWSW